MKQFFICDCSVQENKIITSSFVVVSKQVKPKKTGDPYLALTLGDRTGQIEAKMWDNVEDVLEAFEQDDFLKVKGLINKYKQRFQLTIHKLRKLGDSEIEFADYLPKTTKDIDELWQTLSNFVAGFQNAHLKSLVQAFMSLQAVKAVEIGSGVAAAFTPGSQVHDEIGYSATSGFTAFSRTHNNAGGIEGGISNGEEIRVRGYLKPISTLRRPLQSVDFESREPVKAAYERSDVCVVPAAGVAAEAMVALTMARCALEKFGGDSMTETLRNFQGYSQQLKTF